MDYLIIRKAELKHSRDINRFLRFMVEDIEAKGGYCALRCDKKWSYFEETIKERLVRKDIIFFIAEFNELNTIPVGFAEASIINPGPVFEEQRILHIHGMFVIDTYRGKGIGEKLFKKLLDWGKENNCEEAELNVLKNNPAWKLYKKSGFNDYVIKMNRKL